MQQELHLIKKQLQWLKLYAVISSTIFILFLLSAFNEPDEKRGIIRARGIVIEDSAGRDRILIGSPVPFSKNRVRTDTNMVRKYWAKNYSNPDEFMTWYKDYYNSAEGMVVMNENGFDRVLLGDKLADPNTGKRMFEPAGILWNDKEGWELGGAGVNTLKNGKARAVIGVDDKNGEAVHLIALEDGTKGLVIGGEQGRLLIGMSNKNGEWFQNKVAFTGIKYFNASGELQWEQDLNKKRP